MRSGGRSTRGSDPPLLSGSAIYSSRDSTASPQPPDERTGIVSTPADRTGSSTAMNYRTNTVGTSTRSRTSRSGKTTGEDAGGPGTDNGHADGRDAGHDGQVEEKESKGWWKRQIASLRSLELENKGSVARDHLALERTFLAWLRTSLAFASIGIAITQLFRLNTTISNTNDPSSDDPLQNNHPIRALGKPLGAIFLGISIVTLLLGYHRYFQAQQWIIKGKFPASRGAVIFLSLVAFCLMIVSLVVVVVVQPNSSAGSKA